MINSWGFTLTYHKKRGLRHGSGKKGVLGTGQGRKRGRGLRHGSGKGGGGYLLRNIPVLDIYVSPPPPGVLPFCSLKYLLNNQFFIYGSNYEKCIYLPICGTMGAFNNQTLPGPLFHSNYVLSHINVHVKSGCNIGTF